MDGAIEQRAVNHETAWSAVVRAALALADADEDADFVRAQERLRKAVKRYVRHLPTLRQRVEGLEKALKQLMAKD